jgi:hypothetical protein
VADPSPPKETSVGAPPKDPVQHRRAVELRQSGQSFAAIAGTLGYGRAGDAQRAFLLGLRQLPGQEQAVVRHDENRRLDRLEKRLQSQSTLSDIERQDRIKVLGQLRHAVMKDAPTLDAP